ncbi:alpha/beta hydrolase [Cryptosporangium arvum]|uniref:alpha/beta hydrolase n=1 Tax=Cryptosporangium arvum TaxID=80871 RepID=UPI0004B2DB2C|nr:alpha/beta hydrolase [Cryptosporangium arvum]
MTIKKTIAVAVSGLILLCLGGLALWPSSQLEVPEGARAGSLSMKDCEYDTEDGTVQAECGTLVVPETRDDPDSELIALPVVRIRATGSAPREPIFRLAGGPGGSNMTFPQASRLTESHDLVLVGYRGVDGSRRLDCPEVAGTLQTSDDLIGTETQLRTRTAFRACAERLTKDGVDLTAYSVVQRVEDMEAARKALSYPRIDLLSSSAGTRTAMVYSWRYPASLLRSAMVSVNPPGHMVWDPTITDSQFAQYSRLCAADRGCSARTDDLAATMRTTAGDLPSRWGPLRIKDGNVRVAGMYGMHHNGPGAAPQTAPNIIDAFLSSADGDPSGLWAMSALGDVLLPEGIVWGEFASFAMLDAPTAKAYYAAGGDPGSILGNGGAEFLWGGPEGVATVWPDSPDNAEYRTPRPSATETLLVSGTVDFSTPAQLAAEELLPTLSKGKQVILPELGHTGDFYEHRPEAGKHLLTTFYDTGVVDDSKFDTRPVDFTPAAVSMPTIAKLLAGGTVGGLLIGLAVLGALALRVRRRGGIGRRTGIWLRVLAPIPLGIGGLCAAALLVWSVAPQTPLFSGRVIVPSLALSIGLGVALAWIHPERPARARRTGTGAAIGGAAAGALLGLLALTGIGSTLTAVVGAAAGANLALQLFEGFRKPERTDPAPETATPETAPETAAAEPA